MIMKEKILAIDIGARNIKFYTEEGLQCVIPHKVWRISRKYVVNAVRSISEEYQMKFDGIAIACAGTVKDNHVKFYWGQPALIGLNPKDFATLGIRVKIFNDAEAASWDAHSGTQDEVLTITVGSYIGAYPFEQESFKSFIILSLINGILGSQLCPKKNNDRKMRRAAELLAKVCRFLMKQSNAKKLFLAGGGTTNKYICNYLQKESLQFQIPENPRFSGCRGAIRAFLNNES